MKLTNLFKKQQIKTVDPIVIPTVESLDPKRWWSVEPSRPKVNLPKDIHDVKSAFDWLVWRTDSLSYATDKRSMAIDEIDSFIKNETIDLRHIPGMVCTDCVYLIQYSVEGDRHPFTCVRLNNLNAIDPTFTVVRKEKIKTFLKKAAIAYFKEKDSGDPGSFIANEIKLVDEAHIHTTAWNVSIYKVENGLAQDNYEDDQAYAVRLQVGISLADSLRSLIMDEINNAKLLFKDNVVANRGDEWFLVNDIDEHDENVALMSERLINEYSKESRTPTSYKIPSIRKGGLESLGEAAVKIDKTAFCYHSDILGMDFFKA